MGDVESSNNPGELGAPDLGESAGALGAPRWLVPRFPRVF
jgi:hypothetical protein